MIDRTLLHYNQEAENISSRYEKADMSSLYEIITGTFAAKSRLLELGCGSGRDAGILLRSGLDIIATDGSPSMLKQAAALHPELKGRLLQYELPGQSDFSACSFDGVLANAMLMHLAPGGIKDTLKEVDDLPKALKAAGPQACAKIFKNMSTRAVEHLKNNMDELGPVRWEEAELA